MYERTRETGAGLQTQNSSITTLNSLSFPCATFSGSAGDFTWQTGYEHKVFKDNVTPNWRKRILAGEILPCNPMYSEESAITFTPVMRELWQVLDQCCDGTVIAGGRGGNPFPYVDFPYEQVLGHASDGADKSAWLKQLVMTEATARNKQGYYDLLTEMVYLKQNLSYIENRLMKVTRILTNFRQRAKKILRRARDPGLATRDLAKLRLEYEFVLMQYHYSIKGMIDTHIKGIETRHRSKSEQATSCSEDVHIPLGATKYKGIPLSVVVRKDTRVYAYASVLSTWKLDVLGRSGVLTNPAYTAWDMIPLSWLVDYFINIGDLILALAPNASNRIETSSVTVEQTTELSIIDSSGFNQWGDLQLSEISCGSTLIDWRVSKEKYLVPTLSGFYKTRVREPFDLSDVVSFPRWQNGLSTDAIINTVAYLRSFFTISNQEYLQYARTRRR